MADGDLCTVSQVKHLLPINKSVTTDDPLIQRLITSASETMRNEIGDVINSVTRSEVYDGTGTGKLLFRHQPVMGVASVAIGPPSANRVALTENVDFVFTKYGIQSLGRSFPKGVANIAVTYTAGYVAIPADIAEKTAKVAALRYKEAERLGQSSKTLAGETITFDTKDFPADVMATIQQYLRVSQVPG